MTLADLLVKEKFCSTGPEVQAYGVYGRITVNGEVTCSPWKELSIGDVITLRPYSTNTRKDLEVLTITYAERGE